MIRDRIVMGVEDKGTQEKLLRESDLTLDKAIDFCRAIEASRSQSKILQNEATVSTIKRRIIVDMEKERKIQCIFCGFKHIRGKCPAYGKTCDLCHGNNHFAAVCKKRERKLKQKKKKVNQLEAEEIEDETNQKDSSDESSELSDQFFISSVVKNVGTVNF